MAKLWQLPFYGGLPVNKWQLLFHDQLPVNIVTTMLLDHAQASCGSSLGSCWSWQVVGHYVAVAFLWRVAGQ